MGMGVSTGMNTALERIAVSALALLAAAVIFGLLLILYAGVDPFEAYALMYQGAFGSWFSFQNTLTRAAPLILTALCTALPARLGLIIIGNEGALVVGDDPDGIVLGADFVAHADCVARLDGAPPWVREPLVDWLAVGGFDGAPPEYRYLVEGDDMSSLTIHRVA